jgi:hypothetical protein
VDSKLIAAAGFSIGMLVACKVPNLDHCLHKATDANGWCEEEHPELPYCSPCEAENNGCVGTEPTEESCPEYAPSSTDETGSGSGTGSPTDTGTGSPTDTGTQSPTGSGTDSSS